jgi:hypothetical protein
MTKNFAAPEKAVELAGEFYTHSLNKKRCYIETNLCFLKIICTGVQQHLAPPSPSPLSRQQVVFLSQSSCVHVTGRAYRRERERRVGGGAKSYNGEKAWSSINNSILSDIQYSTPILILLAPLSI